MRRSWYWSYGKRILDLLLALTGLFILSIPLLITIGIGVIIQGRPVFFRQTRIGRHGKPFAIWKLRTMHRCKPHESTITVSGDARITRWGRFLRRFKLDELPQLFCVLRGTMSFVGPRPDVPGYWDRIQPDDRWLLDLRPGITGPASLVFRDEESLLAGQKDPISFNDSVLFPQKVRLTRRYADELGLFSDLKWILWTCLPGAALAARLDTSGWIAFPSSKEKK